MNGTPQPEEGYTPFANELLDALLLADLSKREWAVLMAVARNTYGWSRKHAPCSRSWIADKTGMAESHVTVARALLLKKGVLKRYPQGDCEYGINKHYCEWMGVPNREGTDLVGTETVLKGVPKRYQNGYQNGTHKIKDKTRIKQESAKNEKPSVEEVTAYCDEHDLYFEGQDFIDAFEAWDSPKKTWATWRQRVSTWSRRETDKGTPIPERVATARRERLAKTCPEPPWWNAMTMPGDEARTWLAPDDLAGRAIRWGGLMWLSMVRKKGTAQQKAWAPVAQRWIDAQELAYQKSLGFPG